MKSKNIYSLPLKENTIFLAISIPKEHYSHWKHAIDFPIDFDVPILASLSGEIVDVKDNSKKGGNNKKYADIKYQNYITIKHTNNELSQYGHIANKSSLVKIGDKVKKGDHIAKGIGMVGYTTTPHLHLMVCIDTDNEVGYESLEIKFDKKIHVIRNVEEAIKESSKPKFKRLRELQDRYYSLNIKTVSD